MEAINKQEKQLKEIKNKKKKKEKKEELIKRAEKEEKLERIVLLNDNLHNTFLDYGEMNITTKGEDILQKLPNDEKMITYNFFLKQVILLLIIMIF